MRWWNVVALASLLVAGTFAATAKPQGTHSAACNSHTVRTAVVNFLSAVNAGNLRKLDRLVAPEPIFQWYAVNGGPGERIGNAAYSRSTLLRYFAARHRHSERLVLERFRFTGSSLGNGNFTFELVRSAEDVKPSVLDIGKGALTCGGTHRIAVWAMGPNVDPRLPRPQSYAQTCSLVGAWCTQEPNDGSIPDALRRPLALPKIQAGGTCPSTDGARIDTPSFGGTALGHGPVQPLIAGPRVVFLPYHGRPGWYEAKTLWFSSPDYQGPIFIRGPQLDGTHTLFFGEGGPALADPQLRPGPTLNGTGGWREWPGGTWLRTPGCYAWEVDGTDFSYAIVFDAVFKQR